MNGGFMQATCGANPPGNNLWLVLVASCGCLVGLWFVFGGVVSGFSGFVVGLVGLLVGLVGV